MDHRFAAIARGTTCWILLALASGAQVVIGPMPEPPPRRLELKGSRALALKIFQR